MEHDVEHSHTEELSPEEAADRAAQKLEARLNALIRDPLLTHLRDMPQPWAKLKEAQQNKIIGAVEETARMVIREACHIIAQRGFDCLGVRLKDLAIKDGQIKGKYEATMNSDNVQLLADHENMVATIVLVDVAAFMQGEWAKADPDEPEIPLEGGGSAEEAAETAEDQRRAAGGRS
jgi:hypothetical protein